MRWDIGKQRQILRERLRLLGVVKTWQLVVILLMTSIVAVIFLRLNSLNMVDLRHAVVQADENGDPQELRDSVAKLQNYIANHMNTSLGGGFYLAKSYERDKAAAEAAASSGVNPSSSEYQTASVECRSKWQGGVASFRNDYVKCVQDRIAALGAQPSPVAAKLPDPDLYKVNFASPLWSPDPAGFSVLASLIIVVLIIMRATGVVVLRLLLKRRFSEL